MKEGAFNYIFRMKQDGTDLRKAIPDPIARLVSLSPDDRWIVAAIDSGNPTRPQIVSGYPMGGGVPRVLCRVCAVGSFEIDPPIVGWSFDQKWMYISLSHTGASDNPKTIVIPLDPGDAFPTTWNELVTNTKLPRMRGVRVSTFPVCFLGRTLQTTRSGDTVHNGTSIALACLNYLAWAFNEGLMCRCHIRWPD